MDTSEVSQELGKKVASETGAELVIDLTESEETGAAPSSQAHDEGSRDMFDDDDEEPEQFIIIAEVENIQELLSRTPEIPHDPPGEAPADPRLQV